MNLRQIYINFTLICKGVKNIVIRVHYRVNFKCNYLENIDIECINDIWLVISAKFPFEWYVWKIYFGYFTVDMTYSITSFLWLLIKISGKILILSIWLLCDYWSAWNALSSDIQIIPMFLISMFDSMTSLWHHNDVIIMTYMSLLFFSDYLFPKGHPWEFLCFLHHLRSGWAKSPN